jgi:hypothetical protein
MGEMRIAYKVLVEKYERKNAETGLKEIWCEDLNWFHLDGDGVQ